MGREWVRMEGERARAGEAAARRRAELVVEAQRARVGVEERVRDLEVNVQAVEEKVRGAEAALKEVEARERSRVVRGGGEGGGVAVLAGLAKERVEELRETLVQVRTQRDEGLRRLRELAALLTTFKEEYNPNFNDEGVKRAVRAWEEYAARPAESADDGFEQDLAEIVKPDSETEEGIKWEEWATPEETETDLRTPRCISPSVRVLILLVVYKFEEYLPKTLRDWINNRLYDLRTMLVDNGILAASTPSGSESAAVTTARASLKAAQDEVSGLRTQLQSHRDDLAKDHGRDGVFRALKGRCISTEEGEYTYELCWLGTTKQKPKKGGADTTMGTFARFDTLQVDDDVPADGKGVGSGERVVLRYEHGQSCWNGPSRSTAVVLACAEEDEIWRVVEEEKCVYRMDVGTPAVCDGLGGNGGGGKGAGTAKDEL
jgi:protein kinase C substrate 80K-H